MAQQFAVRRGEKRGRRVDGARHPPVPFQSRENAGRRPVHVPGAAREHPLREPSPPSATNRVGDPDPGRNPDPVEFKTYGPEPTLTKKLTNAADMSGAESEGGLLLTSLNWSLDVSADDGATWRRLDPTTVFPTVAGMPKFCCDQVVIYSQAIDRHIWLMQHGADVAGQGAFRLAVASSASLRADPTAWTFWDFHAGDFGFPTTDMDYPDLACSRENLYLGTDVLAATSGRLVVRIPLSQLQAGGTINFDYTDPSKATNAVFSHFLQQSTHGAVWFGHQSNSVLQIYSLPDGSTTYSSSTVTVATWPNGALSSKGPDGNDWLTKLQSSMRFTVTGAAERPNGHIVVAWTASAGQGGGSGHTFKQAQVRVTEIDLTTNSVVSQMQVWNDAYAFAYPSLAVNAKGDVGILLGWGGPSNHANCAMGIIGDFVVWFRDDSTRTVQRFGDYLTTRPMRAEALRFGAWGYFVTSDPASTASCIYTPFFCRYARTSA